MASRIVSECRTELGFPDKLDAVESALRGERERAELQPWGYGTPESMLRGLEASERMHAFTAEIEALGGKVEIAGPSDKDIRDGIVRAKVRVPPLDEPIDDTLAAVKAIADWHGVPLGEVIRGAMRPMRHVDWRGRSHFDTPRGEASLRAALNGMADGEKATKGKAGGEAGYSIEHATKVAAFFNGLTPESVLGSHPSALTPEQRSSRRKHWVTYDGIKMRDLEEDQIDAFMAIVKRLEKQRDAEAKENEFLRKTRSELSRRVSHLEAEVASLRAAAAQPEPKPSDAAAVGRALKW